MKTDKYEVSVVHKGNRKYSVKFEIGHQGFELAGEHSKKEATWFAEQLAIALTRLSNE
jgi:hypothetical protein